MSIRLLSGIIQMFVFSQRLSFVKLNIGLSFWKNNVLCVVYLFVQDCQFLQLVKPIVIVTKLSSTKQETSRVLLIC